MSFASLFSRLRRPVSLIAMLVVLVHAFAPVVAMGQTGSGARLVEVCSVQGVKKITLSADSTPAAPAHSAHEKHCPLCAPSSAPALPSAASAHLISVQQAQAPPQPAERILPAPPAPRPASRGPPLVA